MELKSIKIRWINYAGYEIILPNGKVVLIDPSLSMHLSEEERDNLAEKFYVHGADYVLISHVHVDHVNDLPTIFKKYTPKVFVGAESAYDFMELYNIPVDYMYPVYPNESYELDGMKLRVFRSKHKMVFPKPRVGIGELEKKVGRLGSIDYMDYCLTTEENMNMFISGGGIPEWTIQNIYGYFSEIRPNIIFRQTSSKWSPEEFAHCIAKWHAPIVFPLHHDGLAKASGMTLDEYFERTNEELRKIGCNAMVLNADRNDKWFEIKTSIEVK